MANYHLGWRNRVLSGTLAAGSYVAGLGSENLQSDRGSPSEAWQTEAGVVTSAAGASLLIDSGDDATTWQDFALMRTNLTPAAAVRWRVGPQECVVEDVPDINVDFTAPIGAFVPPAGWSFARASTASYFDSTLTLQQADAGVPRTGCYDLITGQAIGGVFERAASNSVRNPRGEGAIVGTVGQASGNTGQLPTGWSLYGALPDGVSAEIVSQFTESGMTVTRLHFYGTPTAASQSINLRFEGTGIMGIPVNTAIVKGFFARLGAGATTNCRITHWGPLLDSTLAGVVDDQTNFTASLVLGQWARPYHTFASPASGNAPFKVPYHAMLIYLTQGAPIDITLDLALPQMESGSQALSSPMLPPVGTPGVSSRAADVTAILMPGGVGPAWTIMVEQQLAPQTFVGLGLGNSATHVFQDSTYINSNYPNTSVLSTWLSTANDPSGGNYGNGHGFYSTDAALLGTMGRWALAHDAMPSIALVGPSGRVESYVGGSGLVPFDATGVDALIPFGGEWSAPIGIASGVFWAKRASLWKHRLSDTQLSALATTGSTMTTAGLALDTGRLPAGVVAGVGQSIVVAPAEIAGRYCRVDIDDPSNPDGFLNIPLAYAGPVLQPAYNFSYQSARGRDAGVAEVTTQGGQEYPRSLWQRRRFNLDLQAMLDIEVPLFDELDAFARGGGNVLLVPDAAAPTDAVFGRLTQPADFKWVVPTLRSWSAQITERL